ncbi:DUF362 domain-containing protein [Prolixibacteraceae bacterium JC049]|nr:DUF362 domain-containing protein [Prolixibacteraceae bacterium JC049]
MNRRDFLRKSAVVGTTAAMGLAMSDNLLANGLTSAGMVNPDMVAIRGGAPDTMFDKAIEAWGGMGRLVKKGQRVVVKPNIGWNVVPERGANTNPLLVKQIVKHCLEAGAKEVLVFDHTADVWTKCYKNSGIESAVKSVGGKMVPGNNEKYYHKVDIPKAKRLKETKVHELVMEADVFINVPVLKHHVSTRLSLGIKNLMGIVWDRQYWHKNDLHQCIADFGTFKVPDLTIVDAYNVMRRNGPMGVSVDDVVNQKAQLITTDPVAADAASARMFGMAPEEVTYIRLAHELGVGNMDLSKLNIRKLKI